MVDTVCDQPLMNNEERVSFTPISAFTNRLTIAAYLNFSGGMNFYDPQHDGVCR